MNKSFRLGIDFGYAYTGVGLLSSSNEVLDYKVLKHRTTLSDTLQKRRVNRGQRRRKLSKARRLRDFYALLKGMGLEPRNAKPGEKQTERDKASLGNRLYALAHYRGWDYASLLELLVVKTDDGKSPKCPLIVKEVDRILLQEFNAPAEFNEKGRRKYKNESDEEYKQAQDNARQEFNRRSRHSESQKFSDKTVSFIKIKEERSCLGELYEKAKEIHDLRKKAEKDSSVMEELARQEVVYEALEIKLQDAVPEDIKSWIKERLGLVYGAGSTIPQEEEIVTRIMTMLGLQTGEKLFEEGKVYRPHRNRHREEMLSGLENLMKVACGLEQDRFQICLDETFQGLKKSKVNQNRQILSMAKIKQDWQQSMADVHNKASEIAHRAGTTPTEIKKRWIKAATKVVNREYRKKRFNNRNSMGKCPAATDDDGTRCGLNLPKKRRKDVRRLQFEIELRQMNVRRANGNKDKLDESEIQKLMNSLEFVKELDGVIKNKNQETINQFFTNSRGNRYVLPAENEARGKKDILRDIICGEQPGRAGFCIKHLEQKLNLLERDETKGNSWARLHEERVLTLKDDAPPSIRQKVEKITVVVRKMLKEQEVRDLRNSPIPIEHVGIETARFDISALAQSEGKKLKKKLKPKQYQQSAGGDMATLRADQGGRCIFCGEFLHSDAHIDHLFPKSKGGGNIARNKVIGHSICNIDKHNRREPLDKNVLSLIENNNPEKHKFIQSRLEADRRLPEDMLAAPQHTMFGAKLLKQAFMDEFNLPSEVIHKIRSGDSIYLRRFWFPFMDRQKRAIRFRNPYKTKAGEEFKYELSKLKLDEYLFDGEVSICKDYDEGVTDWLEIRTDKNNGKVMLVGTPDDNAVGTNQFWLENCNNKNFVLEVVKEGKTSGKKKDETLYETKGQLDQELELLLEDVFSKDKKLSKLLEGANASVKLKYRKNDEEAGNDWLSVKGNKLVGTLKKCYRKRGNGKYVPWCDVEVVDKSTGEISNIKVMIKTKIAVKRFKVIVEPAKDDPIREFHHALDAVVLAANVDWEAIKRLNSDVRKQARKENAPAFINLREDGRGNLLAPDKSSGWYVEDKRNEGKIECSKTDTEPLRCLDGMITQRKPLEKIQKKNIGNIQSEPIRMAMEKAWEKIDDMPDDRKKEMTNGSGDKRTITHSYFLRLPQEHILHPKNTRSVRCVRVGPGVRGGMGVQQMWRRKDKNTKGMHHFRRTVSWDKVMVIQYNKDGKDKIDAVRITNKFYWKDKSQPVYERNEIDKELPVNYKILKIFKRGDRVRIDGKSGPWAITKLGPRATLRDDETMEETEIGYKELEIYREPSQ